MFIPAGTCNGAWCLEWSELNDHGLGHQYGDDDGAEEDRLMDSVHDLDQMRWEELDRMNSGRAFASSTFFVDKGGDERLFVCGGDLNGSVETFDFGEGRWSDMANTNVSRESAGIYYDAMGDCIYLGGGHGAQRKVECFDLWRSEWRICPDTNVDHDFHPSMFRKTPYSKVLFIVSPKANLCEYMDEREEKWKIMYDQEFHDKIFQIPDHIDFEQFQFLC